MAYNQSWNVLGWGLEIFCATDEIPEQKVLPEIFEFLQRFELVGSEAMICLSRNKESIDRESLFRIKYLLTRIVNIELIDED
ncbi:MAG: hypothetical protein LBI69_01855 [Puniceicoccales bacterium]|jgi:hypothetical protein|nr:hypothetical protein [Puniceicoccales bacterium]